MKRSPVVNRRFYYWVDILGMRGRTHSAIVIKRAPYREADEVLTCWSWDIGKIRLLARGVRKNESRLKGALSPLAWLEFDVVPSDHLPIIAGVRRVASYSRAGRDLKRVALVFTIFEMILRATPDRQPVRNVSLLLRSALDQLSQDGPVASEFLLVFRYRLLSALGYQPRFDRCSSCGRSLKSEPSRWSPSWHGIVCERCALGLERISILPAVGVEFFTALENSTEVFPQVMLDSNLEPLLEGWLGGVFQTIIERSLNSSPFLVKHA
ncbi:MAG TPA: DNA repair protein RecO [Patescibacteria group bacterium]|nr:DNA repair protein RecO [Patescibacteria group bacterium]